MGFNTKQFSEVKLIFIILLCPIFSNCYGKNNDSSEKIYLLTILGILYSANAENCGFTSIRNGTVMEDNLNDVETQGFQENLTQSNGYKDISNYSFSKMTKFQLDITLREIPLLGLPAFPNEPLNEIISEYIFDFYTANSNYSIYLQRSPSSNHSQWIPSDSRPIVNDNKNSNIFLCSFPTVLQNSIHIECDSSLFDLSGNFINARLNSVHKEGNRTFKDCI